ncbi:MAG: prephenate dehydrogenase/arogenate dehydrogenase family protein, partial [Planctomycetes bacterium]|nr:prephenate dehydrogenase/arogenate dehydrogenase family protein [Planctomycetota bacterium]
NVLHPPDSEFATVAYQHLRKVEELLQNDSLSLFLTIQKENPFATKVRKRFLEELSKIEKQIADSED